MDALWLHLRELKALAQGQAQHVCRTNAAWVLLLTSDKLLNSSEVSFFSVLCRHHSPHPDQMKR